MYTYEEGQKGILELVASLLQAVAITIELLGVVELLQEWSDPQYKPHCDLKSQIWRVGQLQGI